MGARDSAALLDADGRTILQALDVFRGEWIILDWMPEGQVANLARRRLISTRHAPDPIFGAAVTRVVARITPDGTRLLLAAP